MTPERWQQIDRLLEQALELPPQSRERFLTQACSGDSELRGELERLLQVSNQADDFLSSPALDLAARQVASHEARSLAGKKLSCYDVISLAGAGGMGDVYRAKDTRLDRDVAIKVLPRSLAGNPGALARFRNEAKAVAALSHPNILAIFDIGAEQGLHYAVTEWLDGETLQQRLSKGAVSWREAVGIGAAVADGLAAAHHKGIIHRDLKPGNIFMTADGRVKILDFGLARMKPAAELTGSAVTANPVTEPGMVIGTLGYMSPEQVRGEEVNATSDIFALGCVLYELVTGRRAFDRPTAADTMAAIVRDPVSWSGNTTVDVPVELQRVIEHCLEKEPANRYQASRELFHDLSALSSRSGIFKLSKASRVRSRSAVILAVVAALVVLVGLASRNFFRTTEGTDRIQFNVSLEGMTTISTEVQNTPLAVSPDGRHIAFVTLSSGRRQLWLRQRSGVSLQPMAGTENAASPFWSPDSRWVAFFADGKLKKISVSGGPVTDLCDVPFSVGSGTWNQRGVILFGGEDFGGNAAGLYQVSDAGGQPALVAREAPANASNPWFFWPQFLPDGRHFLYLASNENFKGNALYAGSLDSAERQLILEINSRAEYVPPGYLLYVRDGSLMAQPFDAATLKLSGVATPLAEKLQYFRPTGWAVFSATENVLAYQSGEINSQLTWYDRNGRELNSVGPLANHETPRISPDGQRVAVAVGNSRTGALDIWVYELMRDLSTRFTFTDEETEFHPLWSPDGRKIAFVHDPDGPPHLFQKAWGEDGNQEMLVPAGGVQMSHDWSPDGRFILYEETSNSAKIDLWVVPVVGNRRPKPFRNTRFTETEARFSPDGRWVAYVSDESDRREVYVQRFSETPDAAQRWKVSTAGGSQPVWRRDGEELFYVSADNKLMSAPVKPGRLLEIGQPETLFKIDPGGSGGFYDVSPNGDRFLVNTAVTRAESLPITVVVNWTTDEVRRSLGRSR